MYIMFFLSLWVAVNQLVKRSHPYINPYKDDGEISGQEFWAFLLVPILEGPGGSTPEKGRDGRLCPRSRRSIANGLATKAPWEEAVAGDLGR